MITTLNKRLGKLDANVFETAAKTISKKRSPRGICVLLREMLGLECFKYIDPLTYFFQPTYFEELVYGVDRVFWMECLHETFEQSTESRVFACLLMAEIIRDAQSEGK